MILPWIARNSASFFLLSVCLCAYLIPVNFHDFVIKFKHSSEQLKGSAFDKESVARNPLVSFKCRRKAEDENLIPAMIFLHRRDSLQSPSI